jgi:hypothetical protein
MQFDKRHDVFPGHHSVVRLISRKGEFSVRSAGNKKPGTFAVGGLVEMFGVVQDDEQLAISLGRFAIHSDATGKLSDGGGKLELRMLLKLTLPRLLRRLDLIASGCESQQQSAHRQKSAEVASHDADRSLEVNHAALQALRWLHFQSNQWRDSP